MRRGEGSLLSILLQLVLALMLIGILYGASNSLLEEKSYFEQVHAANGALIAQSLLASQEGRIDVVTPYIETYTTGLSESHVTVTALRIEEVEDVSGRSERYAIREGRTPAPTVVNEPLVHWMRTGKELTIFKTVIRAPCPRISATTEWDVVMIDAQRLRMLGLLSDAIRTAPLQPKQPELITKEQARTQNPDFSILYEEENELLVTHTSEPEAARLACLVAQGLQLVFDERVPIEQAPGRDALTITVPKDQTAFQEATIPGAMQEALRRFNEVQN